MTTIDVYNAKALEYAKMAIGSEAAGFLDFVAAQPSGGAVLDLGCGPGHHARLMAEAGLDVTAVDASSQMCALAAQEGDFTVVEATFDDIPDLGQFDGIWASFSLLHAPKSDMPRHLSALRDALVPGGLLTLGMKLGEGEAIDGIGRFYAYYSEAELRDLLRDAGFAPGISRHGTDPGLSGSHDPWVVIDAYG